MARVIRLQTEIAAPVERVFDLARSIDAHLASAEGTAERAVAGVTHGLICLGEEVTWEARHFGIKQRLTVRITAFDRPWHFEDTMISGAFKRMRHEHHFQETEGDDGLPATLMSDHFEFQSPCGIVGFCVDHSILSAYMERFLRRRNAILKNLAESEHGGNFSHDALSIMGLRSITNTTDVRSHSWRYRRIHLRAAQLEERELSHLCGRFMLHG